MERVLRSLAEVEAEIRNGDLLLKQGRRCRPLGLCIMVAGRSDYTHAGMIGRPYGDKPYCLEMTKAGGGQRTLLEKHVRELPGRWDVFAANSQNRWPEFKPDKAVQTMLRLTGTDYGSLNLTRAALLHLAFVRLFVRPDTDDRVRNGRPPYCSHGVSLADSDGGVDVVRCLAHRLVEPGDLARSLFYEYRFTLVP